MLLVAGSWEGEPAGFRKSVSLFAESSAGSDTMEGGESSQ